MIIIPIVGISFRGSRIQGFVSLKGTISRVLFRIPLWGTCVQSKFIVDSEKICTDWVMSLPESQNDHFIGGKTMENQLANFAAREDRGVSMKWHDVQQYVVEIVLLEYGNHIYYTVLFGDAK